MPLTVYNTLTKRPEPFAPADPSRITFYTCGPTVYDDAHIGNFRSFLAADLLRRWVESPLCELANSPAGSPRTVVHVMNITDVGHMTDDAEGGEHGEDKMAVAGRRLAEAKKSGALPAGADINPADPYAIAAFYADRFVEDATRLGLKVALQAKADPSLMPRATANVPGMIAMIRRLIARGHAYAVGPEGRQTVYFDVRSFPAYGRLSGNTLDRLREGAGGRVGEANQQEKRHPADFLLWKSDPAHLMKWDSPWGAGYPGWHIECSVMSFGRLNADAPRTPDQTAAAIADAAEFPDGLALIDIHSGGEDNIFPHHECEIAQSCCALNAEPGAGAFARLWFHPRFLLVEGEKMSKSKGNFFTARDLFAKGVEPAALRLELVKTHYRSNANFTAQGLADSQRFVDRWRRFAHASGQTRTPDAAPQVAPSPAALAARDAFAAAMNDDLNVAGAISALNVWIRDQAPAPGDAAILAQIDAVLGLLDLDTPKALDTDIGLFAPGLTPDPRVVELLTQRRDARAAKDFKRSDAIRDELAAMGYTIKDVPGGKVEVRRA